MSNYIPYNSHEIDTLMKEPWEVSDKPYMLHAAFALNCLCDTLAPELNDDDEEIDTDVNCIWGTRIPCKLLDRMVADISADFNDAADNRKPIRIWGKSYSIRKVCTYDHKRLTKIFNFPLQNGEYIVTPDGVMNLAVEESSINEVNPLDQFKMNRSYLRRIILLAEDDANDGWDRLTDMEVVMYCWAQYYNKYQCDNLVEFMAKYKDFLSGISKKEIIGCFNDKASIRQRPIGMYTFSYEKVNDWNVKNGQKSEALAVAEEDAENYWYDVALKTTFVPMDFK